MRRKEGLDAAPPTQGDQAGQEDRSDWFTGKTSECLMGKPANVRRTLVWEGSVRASARRVLLESAGHLERLQTSLFEMEGVKFNLKQKIYPHFFRGVGNGIRSADDVHESINLVAAHYYEIKNSYATQHSDRESHYPVLKTMYECMFRSRLSQQSC